MDAVCMGLRELTANNQLGIMAEIVRSGKIRVGDSIRSVETASSAPTKP
jgi:MOSC domain-containing protein YiiM